MDQFYEVEEIALYRRRYIIRNPPATIEGCEPSLLSSLVDSSISVELPEGFTLMEPIKNIRYNVSKVDLNGMDGVTRQCVSRLSSLEEEVEKPKKVKKAFINDGSLNVDKTPKVQVKTKRLKSVDWAAIAAKKDNHEEVES